MARGRLSKPPSVVQLPGGVRLAAIPFSVVERNADGSPRLFELMPEGERGDCVLYADPEWIRRSS